MVDDGLEGQRVDEEGVGVGRTGVGFGVDDDDPSVGEDHLDLDEVVDAQAVHPADEPEPREEHDRRPDRVRGPTNEPQPSIVSNLSL